MAPTRTARPAGMFRLVLAAVLGLSAVSSVHARALLPELFADDFEALPIASIFPVVDGQYVLPSNPTTDQLDWLMGELASDETTTTAEVQDHFTGGFLAQFSVSQTQAFLASLRSSFPDAELVDIVTLTPVRVTAVIRAPGDGALGFLQIGATYSGNRRIALLGVNNYGGSTQYPADAVLTLPQAIDKFATLAPRTSLLAARIGGDGTCTALQQRDAGVLRATGSIFKTWVLGGVAEAIAADTLAPDDAVPLVASELAQGGTINSEPLGTQFSVFDLAQLMMGISDNTATDLLHEQVGRAVLDDAIEDSGVADPHVLQPLLGISEQFHLFYSFPLADSQSYVGGSEAFQRSFLADRIEPLGPLGNTRPYFHTGLLTSGSWRASPNDICNTFAWLRGFDGEAARTIDFALGASVAQPDVRARWDRAWYKGGSLASGAGLHVLTHAWMLERNGEAPLVLVAMTENDSGGIDTFAVQSVLGRILRLLAD